jgi:hypothetical protein
VTVYRSFPFIWPAKGPITSEIGPWHPIGIDIGLDYGVDDGIRAAARGTVTFAGGGEADAYGYHVIIDHGGGIETIYAHLERVFAEEGRVVRQGDILGLGGDTGHADGKHLHFEVRKDGSQINPLEVLPEAGAQRPPPLSLDCAQDALVIDSGTPALFDFAASLTTGSLISGVRLDAVSVSQDALPAKAAKESDRSVMLDTSPSVTGSGADDEYLLKVIASEADAPEVTCTVFVRTHTVRTVFYVRPTNTPTPLPPEEIVPPTLTPTPTNTPTPTPTPTKTPYPTRARP